MSNAIREKEIRNSLPDIWRPYDHVPTVVAKPNNRPQDMDVQSESQSGKHRPLLMELRRLAEHTPRRLAIVLVPVIGMAFRRAAYRSWRRMLAHWNRWVIRWFTLRGATWRFEAWHSGRTYEYVLHRHTALRPVDQVLLIHRETGILLQHLERDGQEGRVKDGDMVSAMLSAIQDFVRDSFQLSASGRIQTIEVGGMTVFVEQGPLAIIAGTLSGPVLGRVRETFRVALRNVHDQFAHKLSTFNGDVEPFSEAAQLLDPCLSVEALSIDERLCLTSRLLLLLPVITAVALTAHYARNAILWNSYVATLEMEPGITVINSRMGAFGFHIRGLRDPEAIDPEEALLESGLRPETVTAHWEPYHGLSPLLVLAHARRQLDIPDTVQLSYNNGALHIHGSSSSRWLEQARQSVARVAGVRELAVDDLEIIDADTEKAWNTLLERLSVEPGIVVLTHGRRGSKYFITGLRDPIGMDPDLIRGDSGLGPADVESSWTSFVSLEPSLVLTRSKILLSPPETVELTMSDGVLAAEGNAPDAWIRRTRDVSSSIPGILGFNEDNLINDDIAKVEEVASKVSGRGFQFLVGSPALWPGQREALTELVQNLHELNRLARDLGRSYTVFLQGHTNPSGSPDRERMEAEALAQRFREILGNSGPPEADFAVTSMGAERPSRLIAIPNRDPGQNRVVTLRVRFRDSQ